MHLSIDYTLYQEFIYAKEINLSLSIAYIRKAKEYIIDTLFYS